jgi:inhibitor of KinA sporulation pathway (predicted exonuclease)
MKFPFDIVSLDLEINNPDDLSAEILEIGAVKVKRDLSIDPETFSCLIKGSSPVNPYVTNLTGITNEMVDREGVKLATALAYLHGWAHKPTTNIVLAAWGSDISYLRSAAERRGIKWPFRGMSLDIKSMALLAEALFNRKPRSQGLRSFLQNWGLEFDPTYGPQHRALPDAYNTARILQRLPKPLEDALYYIFVGTARLK